MDKDEKIVIAFPNFDKLGIKSELEKNSDLITLEDTILSLITNSSKNIDICSPFIEIGTIKKIIDLLIKKSYDGVKIRILIRDFNESFSIRIEEVKELMNYIKKKKLQTNFEIRNYHYSKNNKVYSSIHAKFIISDNKRAYIGSGELRYNSINKNFELGVLIKGDKILTLKKIFQNLWDVSQTIK